MTLAFKDASDFSGRTVNQNLGNQVINMDKYAGRNDINVSNHANAFNRTATGAEVWYFAGDAVGKVLAEKVSAAIAGALGIINRGAKPTTNLYVVSQSVGHTILIEWFFIDNPSDVAKWQANKNKAITAVMQVFESYPQYKFMSTHGGHYGENMMDPGAVGNGLKEAVVMQEVNKAMLNYKAAGNTGNSTGGSKPEVDNRSKKFKVGQKVVLSAGAERWRNSDGSKFSYQDFNTTFRVDWLNQDGSIYIYNDGQKWGGNVNEGDIEMAPSNDLKKGDNVKLRPQATHFVDGGKISDLAKKVGYSVRSRSGNQLVIDAGTNARYTVYDWDCIKI